MPSITRPATACAICRSRLKNCSEARGLRQRQTSMATWSKDELRKIAEADDLHISPFREDGLTYGTPTWIWSVAVDDALYARLQREELSLVPGHNAAEGSADHCRRHDEESH